MKISDGPIKQYLLHLNRTMNFVIQDLGETELFIQEKYIDIIQQKIEQMLDENAYSAPTDAPANG